jgi:GT2 family glycosyltransferase/glycosyltransferase involved in cell wall biosynthesis
MQNVGAAANNHLARAKLSVFVISFNRKALISGCLAPLSFADELIVIDKSSTDGTAEIATRYAHRVITVPWSPTVEDTRAFALSQCTHDWILALDDDECLSEEAVAFIEQELLAPRAEIYGIAQRHYILGIHDERAYYWPEFQPRLFRRGAVDFVPTVHGGYVFHSACRYDVPPDQGVCVHHLSHGDVSEWIEKTNRYTSMPDRLRVDRMSDDLIEFAHERVDFWSRQTRDATPGDYPNAVALLRATYDMIDRLKVWEEEKGLDGRRALRDFATAHAAHFGSSARGDGRSEIADPAAEILDQRVATLEVEAAAQRGAREKAEAARAAAEAALATAELARSRAESARDAAEAARNAARSRLASVDAAMEQMRASMSWRVTAPLRGFASRHPHFVRGVLAFIARHPWLGRDAILLVRNAWRLATLRPIVRRTSLAAATADHARHVRAPSPNPTSWFYVGDTLEWLAAHRHLTGVGKVTTEILAAALDGATGSRWQLCVMRSDDLVAWDPGRVAAREGLSPAASDLRDLSERAPHAAGAPKAGDHVLFTGVVWTVTYAALFQRLRSRGVRFSVLLYDLIPLERPDLVGSAHADAFAEWLRCVVSEAELIFLSTETVREQLYRWCLAEGLAPRNPAQTIPFGPSLLRLAEPATAAIVKEPFVLTVGTIDARKNQLFLATAWAKLAAERELPVLVLVGRDDHDLLGSDTAVASLVAAGRIRVLTGVDDAALDALYRAALFIVFPSLIEGHGLPVADSLAYGKLCLSADLPVIREHAGEMPWYFDPHDAGSLTAQLRRALDDVSARAAVEARLAAWSPPTWADTARVIGDAIGLRLRLPDLDSPGRIQLPVALAASTADVLERARHWCVAHDPEVSIIVVNWNVTEMTRACIRHIWANTTGVSYEIIVVDNGSATAGLEVLSGAGGGLRLLPLGINRYFGEANNIGVEAARGRFVCLLNNDVFVSPGWLEGLLDSLKATPDVGAVGPVFLFPDETIQEAGGQVGTSGQPDRMMRGLDNSARAAISDRVVDYISAACLLLSRELFLQAGGFDLAYEPAYYEDVDLCLKLAVLGRAVKLVAAVDVVHLEGFSTGDQAMPSLRKQALGELNRAKFVSRWRRYLLDRDQASLQAVGVALLQPDMPARGARPTRRALIYSPHNLTTGGGERYLLTLAAALTDDHAVTIAVPYSYSHLRLRQLGVEFGINLAACNIACVSDLSGEWDVMMVLGNYVVPPIAARGKRSFFICQFPFPLPIGSTIDPALLTGYNIILAYSDYAKRNIEAALARHALPPRPVEVLYPPVPQANCGGIAKRARILTVGRFFSGGHNKRHDLLIKAFRVLHARHGDGVEFHLAGSSMPDPQHMDYVGRLQELAVGLPVVFHVNAAPQLLDLLYQEAIIYWHGTGLQEDLKKSPELAEHFGIAIVEAMSAGCVAFALNAGGAPEIITDGVDGCLYDTSESLVDRSLSLLRDQALCEAIGARARQRATDFTVARFTRSVHRLVA